MLAAHTFVPGRPGADADAVADYGRALDAYEQATRKLRTGRRLSLLSRRDYQGALRALDEGRHALACLDARLSGEPLPRRLPLCFFDPRHGPSVSERLWAPSGGVQRLIAVCAADAVRLTEGVGPLGDAPVPGTGGSPGVRVPAGSGPVPQQPGASAAAEPLRGAAVPGGKPRMRERCTKVQLVVGGVFALLAVHGAALYTAGAVVGEWTNPLMGLLLALVVSFFGGMFGGLACATGFGTGRCLRLLWQIARHGRRVRADFVRRQTTGGLHRHVFAVTDVSGRRHEHIRTVGGPAVAALPYRTVWYVPGAPDKDNPLGAWAPLWLVLGTCVGTAAFLATAWVTLYLIPGSLIRTLL
ncbi:hypothetical protein [Streptomyces viridosporus]|uniref:hypothetical protein n=1 Tax=Streptomyces viridosporus TaxID=67581 RepID=UPI00331CDC4C